MWQSVYGRVGGSVEFGDLQRAVFAAHSDGSYQSALDLIDEASAGLRDEHAARLVFWRACLLSVAGDPDAALAEFDQALDEGIWWDPVILERDADLDATRALPSWADYRDRVLAHREEVAAAAKPELTVDFPDDPVSSPCPAIVVLHGAWSNAARTRPYWQAALDAGWVLALVQASQPAGTDSFVWTDYPRTSLELADHFAALDGRGDVAVEASVLAGFSQGAAAALRAVLAAEVPVNRFILHAPSFGSIRLPDDALSRHPNPERLEGVVLVGTADHAHDDATRITRELEGRIGRLDFERVEGLGHDAPADFDDRLQSWLDRWTGHRD